MRLVLFAAIAFLGVAHADQFTIIKGGTEYTCSPTSELNPGDALACVDKAYAGPFSREQSLRLCTGASGVGPAECAMKAYAGPFNIEQSIELCKRVGTVANADCAIRAYAGPYSSDEAVQLCKVNAASLMLRSLSETAVDSRKLQNFKDQRIFTQSYFERLFSK